MTFGEIDNTPTPESQDETARRKGVQVSRSRRRRGGRVTTVQPQRTVNTGATQTSAGNSVRARGGSSIFANLGR